MHTERGRDGSVADTRYSTATESRRRSPEASEGDADGRGLPFDRRTFVKLLGAGALLPSLGASGRAGAATDYWSLVAIPDTQRYARSSSLIAYAQDQADWVAANRDSENVVFVAHEGDLVDDGSVRTEWERMSAVMDTLDGVVPYATTPGDHDWAVEEDRSSSTENYREFFGASRYVGRSWFGGSAPNDLSHYQLFSAGGYDFLHIDLEWEAPGDAADPDTPLGWAQSVMDAHPDRATVITTHSYLWDGNPPGRTTFVEENSGDGSSGERIWREVVEPNPQVFMVLCGNFHRGSGSDNGEYHQVSTNAAGLPVYEILANYQDYPNGGDGWLRLVRFIPGGGSGGRDRIRVRTYSPSRDEFATDSSSQFTFDLDFDGRFGTPDQPGTGTLRFRQGLDGYSGTVDTYVQEASPGANNANAPTLNVDTDDPWSTRQAVQALLRFEGLVGSGTGRVPPGSTVTQATLRLQTTNRGDGASLHRMLRPWSATDSWTSLGEGVRADDVTARSSADASVGPTRVGPTTVDVTESAQAWVNGQPNHGWVFLPAGRDGWDFSAAEGGDPPELTVTYRAGTGGGDTDVAVSTGGASDVGETSATLSGTLTDLGGADSSSVGFEYRESGVSSWSTTARQTRSATGAFSETLDGLDGGTAYEFRAVATASDGDTATGAVRGFTTTATPTETGTIAFQQGVDGYSGTVDTYVQEASPSANNANAPTLNVDTDDPWNTRQAVQALLRFEDVVGSGTGRVPPGSTVTRATLTVETTNRGDGASLHRMGTGWSETDSWTSLGNGVQADGTEAHSSADATGGPFGTGPTTFDVTASVQAWANGQPNHGWVFLPAGRDGWDFSSAEGATPPRLEVAFGPGSGGDEPGDTSVAVTTGAASDVGETSATLSGTLTDLGGADSSSVGFEYRESGTDEWTATPTEVRSTTGPFGRPVDGLAGGTAHEFRAVVTASDGNTATGDTRVFTTTSTRTGGTVAFQQGVDGYSGTVDTYVQEASPGANNASATELNVDTDDPWSTRQAVQALLRFEDVVGSGTGQVPPGSTVTRATLTVETTNRGDGASLHRMRTGWSEADSWSTFGGNGVQPDGTEARSSADATTGTAVVGPTTVDVTASVQAWVDGEANRGWVFLPAGRDGWDFSSAEGAMPPRLEVTYE